MKRFFKVAAWIISIFAVIIIGFALYWDRPQEIDFVAILPEELEYCGRIIGEDDAEYLRLKGWLQLNKKGWKNTPASYVPTNTYASPSMSVNVLVGAVVVNYENERESWIQVVKRAETNDLSGECQRANN